MGLKRWRPSRIGDRLDIYKARWIPRRWYERGFMFIGTQAQPPPRVYDEWGRYAGVR